MLSSHARYALRNILIYCCVEAALNVARSCITLLFTQAGEASLLLETHCLACFPGVVGLICNDERSCDVNFG
jgi:hypothetical protein